MTPKRVIEKAVLLLAITACATTGFSPAPRAPETNAVVYVYRHEVRTGSLWDTRVFVDGVEVASLGNEDYTWIQIPAGKTYEFGARRRLAPPLAVKVPLVAGNEYYLEITQLNGDNWSRDIIRTQPQESARNVISAFSYEAADRTVFGATLP
jgi:hypothetical protein